jgi:hypothetical protein
MKGGDCGDAEAYGDVPNAMITTNRCGRIMTVLLEGVL